MDNKGPKKKFLDKWRRNPRTRTPAPPTPTPSHAYPAASPRPAAIPSPAYPTPSPSPSVSPFRPAANGVFTHPSHSFSHGQHHGLRDIVLHGVSPSQPPHPSQIPHHLLFARREPPLPPLTRAPFPYPPVPVRTSGVVPMRPDVLRPTARVPPLHNDELWPYHLGFSQQHMAMSSHVQYLQQQQQQQQQQNTSPNVNGHHAPSYLAWHQPQATRHQLQQQSRPTPEPLSSPPHRQLLTPPPHHIHSHNHRQLLTPPPQPPPHPHPPPLSILPDSTSLARATPVLKLSPVSRRSSTSCSSLASGTNSNSNSNSNSHLGRNSSGSGTKSKSRSKSNTEAEYATLQGMLPKGCRELEFYIDCPMEELNNHETMYGWPQGLKDRIKEFRRKGKNRAAARKSRACRLEKKGDLVQKKEDKLKQTRRDEEETERLHRELLNKRRLVMEKARRKEIRRMIRENKKMGIYLPHRPREMGDKIESDAVNDLSESARFPPRDLAAAHLPIFEPHRSLQEERLIASGLGVMNGHPQHEPLDEEVDREVPRERKDANGRVKRSNGHSSRASDTSAPPSDTSTPTPPLMHNNTSVAEAQAQASISAHHTHPQAYQNGNDVAVINGTPESKRPRTAPKRKAPFDDHLQSNGH